MCFECLWAGGGFGMAFPDNDPLPVMEVIDGRSS